MLGPSLRVQKIESTPPPPWALVWIFHQWVVTWYLSLTGTTFAQLGVFFSPLVALNAVHSKAVILLFFIHYLLLPPLCVEILRWILYCGVVVSDSCVQHIHNIWFRQCTFRKRWYLLQLVTSTGLYKTYCVSLSICLFVCLSALPSLCLLTCICMPASVYIYILTFLLWLCRQSRN